MMKAGCRVTGWVHGACMHAWWCYRGSSSVVALVLSKGLSLPLVLGAGVLGLLLALAFWLGIHGAPVAGRVGWGELQTLHADGRYLAAVRRK